MPFAIKIYGPKKDILSQKDFNYYDTGFYFCQQLDTITKKGIEKVMIITKNLDEIDISNTLKEAEKKFKLLNETTRHYVFKIVEYPEGNKKIDSYHSGEEYGKERD